MTAPLPDLYAFGYICAAADPGVFTDDHGRVVIRDVAPVGLGAVDEVRAVAHADVFGEAGTVVNLDQLAALDDYVPTYKATFTYDDLCAFAGAEFYVFAHAGVVANFNVALDGEVASNETAAGAELGEFSRMDKIAVGPRDCIHGLEMLLA